MVRVVNAAIFDAQAKRVLLAQRSGATSYPFHWCTPGGKVEHSETEFQALQRELREEVCLVVGGDVSGVCVLYERDVVSTRTGKVVRVVCWAVLREAVHGVPTPGDGTADVRWFSAAEIAGLTLAPADAAERERIMGLAR